MAIQNSPAEEESAELDLEIAYVLLLDIVDYSRLLVNEQIEVVRELNRLVRDCACFRTAEAAGKLVRLPTGDGMALLFFESPEQPVKCALEISESLKNNSRIQVRMGVHSGPVNRVQDVNDRSNIAGAGINVAQRVMDCGDGGHILLSKHVADDLAQYRKWWPFLHDLGEYEVKHGFRLHLVNLCKDGLGNSNAPSKLRRLSGWRQGTGASKIRRVTSTRFPMAAVSAAVILSIGALGFSLWLLLHRGGFSPAGRGSGNGVIAEKSIAVLPFENLSDQKDAVYFADGVQDEILTDLAKLPDLKVISRTSVMQYREGKRNLREIGKALGVNYALEGSVQRTKDRVRVTAQLIDARTDSHIWAKHYDAPLNDVFAIQAEVAEKIVGQLQVKLSPSQRAAIEQKPTADLVAFDFYTRAKDLIQRAVFNAPRDEQLVEAITLLNKAVERDPHFAGAYFQLAHAHDQIYFLGSDHTPARLSLAESAIRNLRDLRPDSPEAHLATAKHVYWCYRDYDNARRELTEVGNQLPNDPWPPLILAYMDRRQSRWEESMHNFQRAVALDPRNFAILYQLAITYEDLRRYPEAIAMTDRALAVKPDDSSASVYRAFLEMEWRGDPKPVRLMVNRLLAENPANGRVIAEEWRTLATFERNVEDARRAVAVMPDDGCRDQTFLLPHSWCEGQVAVLAGDIASAQKAFSEAHDIVEKTVREQPNYAEAICVLGLIDAALGRKAEAITEGVRALELVPPERDSIVGARLVTYMARIYALTDQNDLALQQLDRSARMPCGITYDDLLLSPTWDELRTDVRFGRITALRAPKD